jgi:septum site-determining protein MinC
MSAKLVHHNPVILKGRRDGITIELDAKMAFTELATHFQTRVVDAKNFFEGAQTNVSFTGRILSDREERALLNIIAMETTLEVPVLAQSGLAKPINQSFITNSAPAHLPHNEQITSYHQGGLRSGQSIRFNGSVVVVGDANPGSEIVAEGNIIVLGALKGMAHAGCNGNEDRFVSALVFQPTQIRIGSVITTIDKKDKKPACAYIQDGKVYVAPLLN